MSKLFFEPMLLDLQLFADGGGAGDGGTGAEGTGVTASDPSSQKGVKNSLPIANVVYGKQGDAQTATVQETVDDRAARFEELIKGEYKDLYDQRMQDTIQRRLKNSKETVDKYNALAPTLDLLARKYGVDANDAEALNRAIEEDDAYYEDEALEKGVTVEQLKSIKKMERENAELKRQMRELESREKADRLYSQWMSQAESLRQVYPSFNLQAELQNPQFVNLLRSNVDVRTAYEVLHKDEIIPAAMQFTAKQVQQKTVNSIMANGKRPAETGMGSSSTALNKFDVKKTTREQREEIRQAVARGERIVF